MKTATKNWKTTEQIFDEYCQLSDAQKVNILYQVLDVLGMNNTITKRHAICYAMGYSPDRFEDDIWHK